MSNKKGTVPCLVCDEKFKYLTTSHMRHSDKHSIEDPKSVPKYKEWAAEKYGMTEEEIPLSPGEWRNVKMTFESPE